MSFFNKSDPAVFAAIQHETERLEGNLELIASENVVSEAVLEAQGCVMTNKYAEGYPGKRYYGGCEFVDHVESLAIARAKNYSEPIMRTCSLIPERKRIWSYIFRFSSRVIVTWG